MDKLVPGVEKVRSTDPLWFLRLCGALCDRVRKRWCGPVHDWEAEHETGGIHRLLAHPTNMSQSMVLALAIDV